MAYYTLCVRNFVARTPEHWADASLCEQAHSFCYFTIPHGGTKNLHNLVQVFTYYFLVLNYSPPCLIAHFVCATLLHETYLVLLEKLLLYAIIILAYIKHIGLYGCISL